MRPAEAQRTAKNKIVVAIRQLLWYYITMKNIEKLLRDELKKSHESRYRIAQISGVSPAILCRFVNGQRGLSLGAAQQLLEYFGYDLCKLKGR